MEFVPNMPTEEVFFSPDWRRAEGTVRTTAPFFLTTMGAIVEDLELEVRDGTITGVSAARGEAEVQKQFELIPRSRHLGEVAIVDSTRGSRPPGWSTRTCCTTRTSARTSRGAWATRQLRGALELSPEQRIDSGLNQANTHVDIVVGSPEVQIDGIHTDGTVVPVTRGDEFV